MHMAAYQALGLPHTYEKIETPLDDLPKRLAELRHHDLDGINVTLPHKSAVLPLVDTVAATAHAIGAANTLVREADGRIVAHNTDAPALAQEIARLRNGDNDSALAGRSALVLGTGGAARAAVYALGMLGASQIVVRGRREVDLGGNTVFERLSNNGWGGRNGTTHTARERDDLGAVVQCTTAGMHGGPEGSIVAETVNWASVPSDCVAYDVIYGQGQTPFLAAAATRGLAGDSGLGMLVAQGAIAFELWLGVAPPRDVMRGAVL
jgi:shikimate dehydrogenase